MTALLRRGLGAFVTFSRLAVALPFLLISLLIHLLVGGLIGYVVALFATAALSQIFGAVPLLLLRAMGWAVAVPLWAERNGVDLWFRRSPRDTHGSARFAAKAERADLQGKPEGLIIGRDPETHRILRYDGPAHLLTLAPTRAGKGVGTVIPNLLDALRSVLVVDPKGENARITGCARAETRAGARARSLCHHRPAYGRVANAGVVQTFGVNDVETAQWLSRAMGRETIGYATSSHRPGDLPSTSLQVTGRELMTPDEIMQMPSHLRLLRIQGRPDHAGGKAPLLRRSGLRRPLHASGPIRGGAIS